MKEVIEVKANSVYTTEPGKLEPKLELIIIHIDGREYRVKGDKVQSVPIIKECRFFVDEKQLDDMIAGLQLWKTSMVTLKQNCTVMNDIIIKLNGKSEQP